MHSFGTLMIASLTLFLLLIVGISAKRFELHERRLEAVKLLQSTKKGVPIAQNITFTNPNASQFYVDGKSIPEVNFDVGPSWAGLLPISPLTRKLFFWFFPAAQGGSVNDLIFWTNGGPGCSSLEGLLQENGPFSWSYGQAKPTPNQYSWTKLANVLWVEQPVGTGYSQGVPNINNEDELAAQLVGFVQQFLEVFKEMKGKKLYLTGESIRFLIKFGAGFHAYMNFCSMLENICLILLTIFTVMKMSWTSIYKESGLPIVVQRQIPAVDFVHKYRHVFALNNTFMKEIETTAKKCGYKGYMKKHVTYPPKRRLPLPGNSPEVPFACNVWGAIFNASLIVNPAFNVYRIFDTYPVLWDVLGFPGTFHQSQTTPLYFDRQDVKKAIHAPTNVTWVECSGIDVFPKGDASLPPAFTVLPSVIEKNARTVIIHGLADFIFIADGTRIVIQNMTWAGKQGFQKRIAEDSFLVDGVGAMGTSHLERKLAYVEVVLSGHMVPQFSPVAAFQTMQYLLGMRENP